jgi:2'-5' RNA ligase
MGVPQDLFGDVPAPVPRPPRRRAPAPAQGKHAWFFALRPGAGDAARIDAFAGRLLASHGVAGKRIGPERLHVSLDAVGHDVDAETVDAACRAADMVQAAAFEVCFDAVETYGGPSLVLLPGDGLAAVQALRLTLACALADEGFKPPKAYGPHMTLCHDPRPSLVRTSVESIGFRAAEFALVKSHLGFSRHEVVRTWPLASM